MKRKHLAACLYNSAAMLLLADAEPPEHVRDKARLKEWRKSVRAANAGQANILRTVAQALEAGEKIEE